MTSERHGQVSLVTGAARGVGLAISDRFAADGSRVFYTDIDEAELSKTSADRPRSTGRALDVTNGEQIESVTKRVVEDVGRLDILVNHAGVNTVKGRATIDECPRDEWDRILAVETCA